MSTQIDERIARSARAFQDHIWPIVKPFFGPGELVPVEATGSALGSHLDRRAGVDYLFVPTTGPPVGLASRVSHTKRAGPERRFTMGVAEHERLTTALEKPVGQFIPSVRIQASATWANDLVENVDNIGLVRIPDLIRLGAPARERHDGPTGSYWSWDYDALARCDVIVIELPHPRFYDPFITA